MKLPPVTQQPLLWVNLTPDDSLPLRILRTYRENCNCMWADNTGGEETKDSLLATMNKHNRQRAAILDQAIALLEKAPSLDLEGAPCLRKLPKA